MKGKFIGAVTGIAIIVLISGAAIMNSIQQSSYVNNHNDKVTLAQNDTSFAGTHLSNPNDDQEAF